MALYVEESWPEESCHSKTTPPTPVSRATMAGSILAHYTPSDHDEVSCIAALVWPVLADSSNKDDKPTDAMQKSPEEPTNANKLERDVGAIVMRDKEKVGPSMGEAVPQSSERYNSDW
jgi:hypothetical protein